MDSIQVRNRGNDMSSTREASSRHMQAAKDHLAAAEQHQKLAKWYGQNQGGHAAAIIALRAQEASKAAHASSVAACSAP